MTTTGEECIDALLEAADRLGESPTKAQYEALGLTPASTTIRRVVGGWNEAKRTAGLETFEQGENGGRDVEPKPGWVTLPEGTDWTGLTAAQRWYFKNRDYQIETKERRRRDLREWFTGVKQAECRCRECGEERSPALDFHHPDRKNSGVSQMVNHGYSKGRIREEMDRCIVLCANCHREEHYEGPDPSGLPNPSALDGFSGNSTYQGLRPRHAWLLAYKRDRDGCNRCSVANPICLDFHHRGPKTTRVSRMVTLKRTPAEIKREIENCVLLCANCHRVKHHGSVHRDR